MRCVRGRVWAAVRVLLACGILGYVLWRIHPARFLSTLASGRPGMILLLVAMAGLNLSFQVGKWRLVLRLVWPDVSIREAFRSFVAGLSLGILTPGRVGELGRAFFLPARSRSVAAGLAVLDRVYTMSTFVALGLLAASWLSASVLADVLEWVRYVPLAWLLLLSWPGTIGWLGSALGRRFAWADELEQAASLVRLRHTVTLIGVNLLYVLYVGLQFSVAVAAYSAISWPEGLLAGLATLSAKILIPLSVGDLGVREAASVLFYRLAGATPAAAFSGALSLYVVNVAVPAIFGLRWVAGAGAPSPAPAGAELLGAEGNPFSTEADRTRRGSSGTAESAGVRAVS